MKRILILLSVVLLAFCVAELANAATIGPDAFGYMATDEIVFDFEDISGSATATNFFTTYTDDGVGSASIGFDFNFYGTNYDTAYLSTNGLLTFTSGSTLYTNHDLSGPLIDNLPTIAPYWDDLVVDPDRWSGAGVYFETIGSPGDLKFIAQWELVRSIGGQDYGTITFQTILDEASNSILFQYLDAEFDRPGYDNGVSATVGIRNINGESGEFLQWSYNQAVISNEMAILFSTQVPEPSTLFLIGTGLVGLVGFRRKFRR